MTEIPRWLSEPYRKILVTFKRQGGRGTISDVRRAAKLQAGDRYAKKLVAEGLFWHQPTDNYGLTPDGYTIANDLVTRGY
jgi:Mn-dependent DtxR family transcriptional regulator